MPALRCWWSFSWHNNILFHGLWPHSPERSYALLYLLWMLWSHNEVAIGWASFSSRCRLEFDQTWDGYNYQKAYFHLALLLAGLLCEYGISTAVTTSTNNFKIGICNSGQPCYFPKRHCVTFEVHEYLQQAPAWYRKCSRQGTCAICSEVTCCPQQSYEQACMHICDWCQIDQRALLCARAGQVPNGHCCTHADGYACTKADILLQFSWMS